MLSSISKLRPYFSVIYIKGVNNSKINISNNSNVIKSLDTENLVIDDLRTISTEITQFYTERFYNKPNSPSRYESFLNFDVVTNKISLLEAIEEYDKILLLGGAGLGKTTELKHLFNEIWKNIDKSHLYPIYINLKSFRNSHKISDFINLEGWHQLPNIIFILDGLDEVADIEDLMSEIETFISQNEKETIKYIISCRTNIYEKYSISLDSFTCLFLRPLSSKEIDSILSSEYGINLTVQEIFSYERYLENPFTLNLFAQYYNRNNTFPNSKSTLWDIIINNEISDLFLKRMNKRYNNLDRPYLMKILKKLSLINELRSSHIISIAECSLVLSQEDRTILSELPFIENENETISFKHKNYQEFFAAKFLSNLSIDQIKKIFQVGNTNKTKPYLFNVLSFLIALLDDVKSQNMIKWLYQNKNEVIFYADPKDINDDLRKKIFIEYFKDNFIEKTYWITDNRNVPVESLARFADFEYLINIITDTNQLNRTILNALKILKFSKIPAREIVRVKALFLTLLENYNLDNSRNLESDCRIKAAILRVIKEKGYYESDKKYFEDTLELFRNETDREINLAIVSMIAEFDNVDNYFSFIENEIQLRRNIKKRKYPEEIMVADGFQIIVDKIIPKIFEKHNFIKLLDYLFNPEYDYDSLSQSLTTHRTLILICTKFKMIYELDGDILISGLDLFLGFKHFNLEHKILLELINSTESQITSFNHIVQSVGFKFSYINLLIELFTEESIDFLVKNFSKNQLRSADVEYLEQFRNRLFNSKRENEKSLALKLNDRLIQEGFKFNQPLIDEVINRANREYQTFAERNFFLIFDKTLLLEEIKQYFISSGKTELSYKELSKAMWEWYEQTNYHGLSNTVFQVLMELSRHTNITYESVEKSVNNKFHHLSLIKQRLEDNRNNFNLSSEHIKTIQDLCIKVVENMSNEQFDNVITKINNIDHSFSYVPYTFRRIQTLYFFDLKFNSIILPLNFYYKTLKYSGCIQPNNSNNIFDHIRSKINNEDKFKSLVIENITNGDLDFSTITQYCNYILDENIYDYYFFVEESLISDTISGYQGNILETYLVKINYDFKFLKKSLSNVENDLGWQTLKIYLKQKDFTENEKKYIAEISQQYIKSKNRMNVNLAIDVLFYTNQPNAIEMYWRLISNELLQEESVELTRRDYEITYFKYYSHLSEIELLKPMFLLIFGDTKRDFYAARNFFNNIVIHLSSTVEGYSAIQAILKDIKNSTDNDTYNYFVNKSLQNAENSYVHSLIKIPTLEESIKLVESLK